MDTRYGKYGGEEPALTALAELWHLNGDTGHGFYSAPDGSGLILFRLQGPTHLSWHEARELMADHDCGVEDLDSLDRLLLNAVGVAYEWDSAGFQNAEIVASPMAFVKLLASIESLNLLEDDE